MSLPNLNNLRQELAINLPPGDNNDESILRQWTAALATLHEDFLIPLQPKKGFWLAASMPFPTESGILQGLDSWIWSIDEINDLSDHNPQTTSTHKYLKHGKHFNLILKKEDGNDPFLILVTPQLQIYLAIHGSPVQRQLLIRTDPINLYKNLKVLNQRIDEDYPVLSKYFYSLLKDIGPLYNNEILVESFWPLLAQRLVELTPKIIVNSINACSQKKQIDIAAVTTHKTELTLLEALTHEVRTPLSTIRTLIRSLLRKNDLTNVVRQRLLQIDGECSEQIDRFGLIFHAVELQRQPEGLQQLARTNLSQLLLQLQPIWQQQLERRGLQLSISITPKLPEVLSDPSRLETMLGGLVARYSRNLSSSQTIQLSLTAAGARLKLQLHCESQTLNTSTFRMNNDDDNPVLTWNPNTGNLQLSKEATQKIFHSLGGQFTEGSGNGLIVFFPLAEELC
uniref:Histidine kinase domain-containing protein n=1 Tax=Paulinella chromatophora TaxID=39717 RepID=B1X523_PAUCH|nr:hypothetical protein PCC_0614 [Paulinella chromatophora]ACB43042.1 hypothetical protein PCC_0614 [Paulinella chromatophora]